jgi:hypothetical protein
MAGADHRQIRKPQRHPHRVQLPPRDISRHAAARPMMSASCCKAEIRHAGIIIVPSPLFADLHQTDPPRLEGGDPVRDVGSGRCGRPGTVAAGRAARVAAASLTDGTGLMSRFHIICTWIWERAAGVVMELASPVAHHRVSFRLSGYDLNQGPPRKGDQETARSQGLRAMLRCSALGRLCPRVFKSVTKRVPADIDADVLLYFSPGQTPSPPRRRCTCQ